MKYLITICCFIAFAIQISLAQTFRNKEYKDYLPYEVGTKVAGKVYLEGDTIQGMILVKPPARIQDKLKFFTLSGEKIGVIHAKDALGFEYGEGISIVRYKSFSSEDIPKSWGWDLSNLYQGNNVFLLILETGRLNLYKYYYSSPYRTGFPNTGPGFPNSRPGNHNGIGTNTIQFDYILELSNSELFKIPAPKWKEDLSVIFENYPLIAEKLDEKKFKIHDIPELIMEFNKVYAEKHGDGNLPSKEGEN